MWLSPERVWYLFYRSSRVCTVKSTGFFASIRKAYQILVSMLFHAHVWWKMWCFLIDVSRKTSHWLLWGVCCNEFCFEDEKKDKSKETRRHPFLQRHSSSAIDLDIGPPIEMNSSRNYKTIKVSLWSLFLKRLIYSEGSWSSSHALCQNIKSAHISS